MKRALSYQSLVCMLEQMSSKDAKKIADKERKARERALAMKEAALRDDDNVFDVAYEGMGESRTAAQENATDVKVHSLSVLSLIHI